MVYTEVHLTREQQAELQEATKGDILPRVAVVSPSTAARFVASMFTLLNRNIRFFPPSDYSAAMTHLGFSRPEVQAVTRCYEQLMERVQAGSRFPQHRARQSG